MTLSVDLNADMGESFGSWTMGNDAALLKIITSANIACGFHAGDPSVMARTMILAQKNNVSIGVHPGFFDLQGFGRRRMDVPYDFLGQMIQYQIGAAQAMARGVGARVRHLKLHGALANMAAENYDMALTCYQAALKVAPDIIIIVLAGTAQQKAVETLHCATALEIFADRAYNDDATLRDRSLPNAVIDDPLIAGKRIVDMVQAGAIITASGRSIKTRIDTICLHGDTPRAVEIASTVRDNLQTAGINLCQFKGMPV